jgi:hypothetical protein
MRANAQMVLSRARQQGTLRPAHAHRANISHQAALSALPMPIVPTSLIKRPTAILSNILMIVVISLTAVPSVLHVVALRRVVCEFPWGCCIILLLRCRCCIIFGVVSFYF